MGKRKIVGNIIKLKLETMGLATEMLPKPVRERTVKYQNELLQVMHDVTGEYLAEKKDADKEKKEKNGVHKVEIN